jgi:hypothetical protein
MTIMRQVLAVTMVLHAYSAVASAHTSDGGFDKALSSSLAATAKAMHATIRREIAEAANIMPAEDFGFKPTPDVRSFAQLVGHVINANVFFCSQATGASMPTMTNFERVTDKTALVKGLTDALAYCYMVYESTTDVMFNQAVTLTGFPGMNPKTATSRGAVGVGAEALSQQFRQFLVNCESRLGRGSCLEPVVPGCSTLALIEPEQ